jgi:hypothetical protein
MNKRVICIHGLLGSGKSTAASYLKDNHGFVVEKFAGTLKSMVRVLLEDAGIPESRIKDYLEGSQEEKMSPIPEMRGVSCRHIMQMLGSEFRDTIHSDLWTDTTNPRVVRHLSQGSNVVIDDFRFQHEHSSTQKYFKTNILYLKVEARDHDAVCAEENHQSERPLPNNLFQAVIKNNGSIDQLYKAIDECLKIDVTKNSAKIISCSSL